MTKFYEMSQENGPGNVTKLSNYREHNRGIDIDYSDFQPVPRQKLTDKELAKGIGLYMRRLAAGSLVALALGAGAAKIFGGGGDESISGVNCSGEQTVLVPQGSNYSELAYEHVNFPGDVSPEGVTDNIEAMNGSYIAPAGKEIVLPLSCENAG